MDQEKETAEVVEEPTKAAVEAVETEIAEEAIDEAAEEAAEKVAEEASEEETQDTLELAGTAIKDALASIEPDPAYSAAYAVADIKAKPNTLAHWIAHVIMALIIALMCFLMFTNTGKLIQEYGWNEGTTISSAYGAHDWGSIGLDLDTYAYYYEMYNEYFQTYSAEYEAMGIYSMNDLMDAMWEDAMAYYSDGSTTAQ